MAAFNEKDIESELCHPLKGTALAKVVSVNTQSNLIREVKVTWAGVQSPFIAAYNIYRGLKADDNFAKIKKIKPYKVKPPFTLDVQHKATEGVSSRFGRMGVQKLDSKTTRVVSKDFIEVMRSW